MNKIFLFVLFIGILISPGLISADGPYLNIPPTNAFDKAHSQNGTINAVNFSMPINFIGRNGVNVTSNNSTHTIIIIGNGTGPRGATGATGNFTCNTANNCVNLNDSQIITGSKDFLPGIKLFNQYILGYRDSLSQEAKLQGLTGSNFSDSFVFMPRNDTANAFTIDIAADPIVFDNEILLQALQGLNQITGASNSSGSLLLKTINASSFTVSEIEMLTTSNNINFHNAQLNSIGIQTNPTDAQRSDHLGIIGNLTQNKCSNLEFLAYQQSNQTWICSSGSTHGTYNETLANNAVINSGGSKINFINGTNNPVNVKNSNSGQQVNVTISSPNQSLTQSLVDMTSIPSVSTTDNDTADTLISATSEPASPQFVQTVGALPANSDVSQWGFILTVGGKNTDTHNKQLTVRITINNVNVGSSSAATTVTTTSPFWRTQPSYCGQAINQNDKVGLKMWSNVTNTVDFRYATIYIIPCDFKATGTVKAVAFPTPTTTTTVFSGAVTGVTYSATGFLSSLTTTDTTLGSQTATQYSWFFSPQTISMMSTANTNVNTTPAITITGTSQLASITSLRYYEKVS